jgi:peptidyl-prolyl cis-trans isomerase A (cyclophilin A)
VAGRIALRPNEWWLQVHLETSSLIGWQRFAGEGWSMHTMFLWGVSCVLLLAGTSAAPAAEKEKAVRVVIETDKGDIEVELDAARAPRTVANFLRYVDGKFYDGGRFHRTVKPGNQLNNKVKIEVIQAGINPERIKEEFAPIKLERTRDTKLSHKDGTISMARDGPDTATSDFFLCIGAQPELDFGGKRNPDGQGFAAFGKVVKGMDVVKKIQASPAKGQDLDPPVKIRKITRKQ